MTTSKKKPLRILLVDDEADLVEFMSHLLLKKGFTVTATNSGPEALEALSQQIFDVAIVDLKMPEMDGIEVLEKMREIQPYVEAIMLTGHGSFESAHEAGRLKAFRYLIKPYGIDDLLEQIIDAAKHRERKLEAAYQAEMEKLMAPGHTPQDILHRGEELRRKYERD